MNKTTAYRLESHDASTVALALVEYALSQEEKGYMSSARHGWIVAAKFATSDKTRDICTDGETRCNIAILKSEQV